MILKLVNKFLILLIIINPLKLYAAESYKEDKDVIYPDNISYFKAKLDKENYKHKKSQPICAKFNYDYKKIKKILKESTLADNMLNFRTTDGSGKNTTFKIKNVDDISYLFEVYNLYSPWVGSVMFPKTLIKEYSQFVE